MDIQLLPAALFLPLFPLSMVFNAMLERLTRPLLRAALLLLWPLPGVYLLLSSSPPPHWLTLWAALSALLYALRLPAMRDMGVWVGYLATSAWSLQWLGAAEAAYGSVLGFAAPLALLALLIPPLEARLGAAYTFLRGGLAAAAPRLAGVLVFCVLAAVATPVFPAFFGMLRVLLAAPAPAALLVLGVWLLWSWAAARLLHGLIVGPPIEDAKAMRAVPDLGRAAAWGYALPLAALAAAGAYSFV